MSKTILRLTLSVDDPDPLDLTYFAYCGCETTQTLAKVQGITPTVEDIMKRDALGPIVAQHTSTCAECAKVRADAAKRGAELEILFRFSTTYARHLRETGRGWQDQ